MLQGKLIATYMKHAQYESCTVPGHTRVFTREVINSNAKRQTASAEYVDNAEVCESNSEAYPLQTPRNSSCRCFCSFITTEQQKSKILC